VALGLAKVFEREDAHELCSVSGVYRLAKHEQIQDIAAARAFVGKYGITVSEDWTRDVDQVFSAQRSWIRSHMQVIDRVRNTRLAHIQQDAPMSSLPSIAAFEELLAFAFELHAFVVEHAIGGMKRYNILVHSFRNHKEHFEDDVIGICAGLWNLVLSS